MPGMHRKHTPITSKAQQGMFGAEYARRKAGKASRMKGITTEELSSHLKESKGKKLPMYRPKGPHSPTTWGESKMGLQKLIGK